MDIQYIESKLLRRPHSPMFARLANEYLASGKIEEALELCTSGLERFPRYSTAHLVRAKCLAAKEDYVAALISLHNAITVFPDSVALRKYEAEWKEKAIHQNVVETIVVEIAPAEAVPSPAPEIITRAIVPETPPPVVSEPPNEMSVEIPPAMMEIPKVAEEIVELSPPVIAEKILEPKEQIIPPVMNDPVEAKVISTRAVAEGGRIVSKTLAEIYATQGEFEEAILTYQLLKQQRPQNAVEFERRIKELEVKLQSKQA